MAEARGALFGWSLERSAAIFRQLAGIRSRAELTGLGALPRAARMRRSKAEDAWLAGVNPRHRV